MAPRKQTPRKSDLSKALGNKKAFQDAKKRHEEAKKRHEEAFRDAHKHLRDLEQQLKKRDLELNLQPLKEKLDCLCHGNVGVGGKIIKIVSQFDELNRKLRRRD